MQLFSQPQKNYTPTFIPDDVPVYRVNEQKFYADDRLFEEGKIIIWEEEPNDALEPLNEMAKTAMKKFKEKLDIFGKAVAEKTGKAFVSQADAFENAMALAQQEGKSVRVLNEARQVPLMGGKQKRKRKVKEIELAATMDKPEVVNNRNTVNQLVGETVLDG